jgi:hypothetical protein
LVGRIVAASWLRWVGVPACPCPVRAVPLRCRSAEFPGAASAASNSRLTWAFVGLVTLVQGGGTRTIKMAESYYVEHRLARKMEL